MLPHEGVEEIHVRLGDAVALIAGEVDPGDLPSATTGVGANQQSPACDTSAHVPIVRSEEDLRTWYPSRGTRAATGTGVTPS